MKYIAFTGGGSGGHITPIASLIEYGLQDTEIWSQCKLFRFGEADSLEEKICTKFPEVTFIRISAGKLRRYRTIQAVMQNIQDLWLGIKGIFSAGKQLKQQQIQHVFCKGGHVALPVCIAAYVLRIPISMHESDTYAGMTNRIVAKIARHRFVGFPGVLPPSTAIGQLLSPHLLHPEEAFFDLSGISKPVVLVMGGSQGAGRLFDRLCSYLKHDQANSFHFLVLLGSKNSSYAETFASYGNVDTFTFIEKPEQMARLYQISDVSITRGSATSLAEQHLFGIHKIIVPTPYTGGNHQWYNGLWYRDTYGDILIEQNETLDVNLTETIYSMSGHKKTHTQPAKTFLETPLRTVWNVLTEKY